MEEAADFPAVESAAARAGTHKAAVSARASAAASAAESSFFIGVIPHFCQLMAAGGLSVFGGRKREFFRHAV